MKLSQCIHPAIDNRGKQLGVRHHHIVVVRGAIGSQDSLAQMPNESCSA